MSTPSTGRGRKRLTVLAALVAGVAAFGVTAGSAAAVTAAQSGRWCGIDAPQKLATLHQYLVRHKGQTHYGSCAGAYRHVFNRYKTRSSKVVRFQIRQRRFLKEMFVGNEQWIEAADIGMIPTFSASENGHNVRGTLLSNFVVEGTVWVDGRRGWFYAIWVSS